MKVALQAEVPGHSHADPGWRAMHRAAPWTCPLAWDGTGRAQHTSWRGDRS